MRMGVPPPIQNCEVTVAKNPPFSMPTIGASAVTFDHVSREWRCKYTMDGEGGPAGSTSLKACEALLQEYLPKLKALPAMVVQRVVCGGCGDFKVVLTQPCAEHDAWKAEAYSVEGMQRPLPSVSTLCLAQLMLCGRLPAGEFLEKLKAIGAPRLRPPNLRAPLIASTPPIASTSPQPPPRPTTIAFTSLVRRGHEPSRGAGVHVRDALSETEARRCTRRDRRRTIHGRYINPTRQAFFI